MINMLFILFYHYNIASLGVLTVINHLRMYITSINLNYLYNVGFILGILIVLQTVSGVLITLTYYSSLVLYSNIYFISYDYYYGYLIRNIHIIGVTLINIFILVHIFKGIIYSNISNHAYIFYSGLCLYLLFVVISYLGYILTYGMISFWGATVIINLLSPDLALLILGSYLISIVTINRYLVYHILLTLVAYIIIIVHIYYLHAISSYHVLPYKNSLFTNLTFLYYLYKDMTSILVILTVMLYVLFYIVINLSHSNNLIEINLLVTPSHIIPEWYFLYLYSILKLTPSKLGGLLIIVIYIFSHLFLLSNSSRSASTTVSYNISINSLSNIYIYLLLLVSYAIQTYVGLQLPIYIYLLSARICLALYFVMFLFLVYSRTVKSNMK